MSRPVDAAIVQPSIVNSIYSRIRDEIFSGLHLPGTALRQDDIASRFGISKIPLREAFSRLESEGLLTLRPRRGYAVSEFNVDDIREIFNLRAIIEEHAGRLSALARTEEDVATVRALAMEMEALDVKAPDYYMKWSDLNRDFHGAIIQASKKMHVIKIALQLRDVVEPYIRLDTTMTGDEHEVNLEHRQIVAAFESGDAHLVGALSAAHCYHTRDRLVASLERAARVAGEIHSTRRGRRQTNNAA